MGRKAKPIDLHLVDGNPNRKTKKEIEARREAEAAMNTGTDKVKPPSWLAKKAKALFKKLAKGLIETDRITNDDVEMLALYCDAYIRYQTEWNPRTRKQLFDQMAKAAGEFGFTPAARAKLAMPKRKKEEPTEFEKKFGAL